MCEWINKLSSVNVQSKLHEWINRMKRLIVFVCVPESNINCIRVNVHELFIGTIYWTVYLPLLYAVYPCNCCYHVAALRFLPSYPGEVYLIDVYNSVNYPIDVCKSVNYPIDV